jgi:hypothetical protein
MGAEYQLLPTHENQNESTQTKTDTPSIIVHPLENHRYNGLINFTNKVHEKSHLAGSVLMALLVLLIVPFNAFFVGMAEVTFALLIRPWVKVTDLMFNGFSMQTTLCFAIATFATLYGVALSSRHYYNYYDYNNY